ncbi:MAG: 50S ribosomal protein L23 [Patescibacteria group bacterium]
MNLLDFFKKREKIKRLEKSAAQAEPVLTQDDAGKSESRKVLGESKSAASVLQKPRITEKSSIMNERGVYVFRVASGATKPEVKKAVEELYKVRVEKVNMINMPSRLRRLGRKIGRRPGYRKASVRIAHGQKIEFS